MYLNTPEADDKEEQQQDREEEATRGRGSEYGGCIGSSMRRGLNHFYCNQMKEGTQGRRPETFSGGTGKPTERQIYLFCALPISGDGLAGRRILRSR